MGKNGRIVGANGQPTDIQIQVMHQAMPLAGQSAMSLIDGGDPKFAIFGGFTKLEAGALQIAAGLMGSNIDSYSADSIAERAAEVAGAVLVECQRREQPAGPPSE